MSVLRSIVSLCGSFAEPVLTVLELFPRACSASGCVLFSAVSFSAVQPHRDLLERVLLGSS